MTTFNAAILVTADASAARRELKTAETSLQALGPAAKTAGTTAATGLRVIGAETEQLRRTGAGVTGNLVAQFNDIGVMLAAGQSPLLLAVQQGSQISQALGPLGAGGAVQALGAAFVGMLNPISLITVGTIAAGAAMVQWLIGAGANAETLEDRLGQMTAAVGAFEKASDQARQPWMDMQAAFGAASAEVRLALQDMAGLAKIDAYKEIDQTSASLHDLVLELSFFDDRSKLSAAQDFLGLNSIRKDARVAGAVFAQNLALLRDSVDPAEKLAVAMDLRSQLLEAVGGYENLNEEQATFLRGLAVINRDLGAMSGVDEGSAATSEAEKLLATLHDEATIRELITFHGEDSRRVAVARAEAERQAFSEMLAGLTIADGLKASLREAWEEANGVQGSVRELAASLFDAAGAGDETQRAIADAWGLLSGAADATNIWAIAMAGVAAEVRGIGAALATLGAAGMANASKQIELEALRAGKSTSEARRTVVEAEIRQEGAARARAAENVAARNAILLETETRLHGVEIDRQIEAERRAASERDRASGQGATRGAVGGGKRGDLDATERYVNALERERDILRETDPVQKEMIRNRAALAGATAETRLQVEQLIAGNIQLEEQQRQSQEAWEFTQSTVYDVFDALILQGEKASDVMATLAGAIAKALLQSALLGDGPLAGIFGGQGTGLFGIIGGALGISGAADGGLITGPGGPRDDRILTWLSNGEFVVNAASAARHRPLLEQINAAPRFASGGVVGGTAGGSFGAQPAGQPIVIDLRLSDDLNARIAETSRDVSVQVMKGGLRDYDSKVLPRRLKAVQGDPRRVG